ncbi:MAG: sulfur oxidation c-type cytochrome SoxA [Betaproteobacteria bacterium]|nr:sulfur oxidation c-type cytochrome SoxA [Betaproteobacteria bacterium]
MSRWPRAVVLALLVGALGLRHAVAAESGADSRRSGFAFMAPSTQAMQRDDTQNPGMLWVGDGEASWRRKAGKADQACADCHGAASASMRGVAARLPDFDPRLERPVNLAERVNLCRERHQQAVPLRLESQELLSLEAFVAFQSRGMPIAPPTDARLAPFRERGQQLFRRRMGQLDLACTQCHDDSAGKRLASSVIPQAHPTGYPIYRLEWQSLGSLQRRLRGCLTGIRAEPFAYGSIELVNLELYLASRAAGLPLETPAVRP